MCIRDRLDTVTLLDGVEAVPTAEMIEFYRGEEDLGVCSYPRFATQARKALDKWFKDQNLPEDADKPQPEKVIDAEFSEIQSAPTAYDKAIMEDMIRQEERMLEHMGETWKKKQPYYYTKHTMMLEAYRMLQAANEGYRT